MTFCSTLFRKIVFFCLFDFFFGRRADIFFWNIGKEIWKFRCNFSAGLPKILSMRPEESFEDSFLCKILFSFFELILDFELKFLTILGKTFRRVVLTGFSKVKLIT